MRSGCCAGFYGLLVLKAGFSQVDVHIHQPGAYGQSRGINHLCVRLVDIAANDGHFTVFHQNVHHAADTAYRVHQAALTNQQFHWITPS